VQSAPDELFQKSAFRRESKSAGVAAVSADRVVLAQPAAVVLDAHAPLFAAFGLFGFRTKCLTLVLIIDLKLRNLF
jgi:hypothetical protein